MQPGWHSMQAESILGFLRHKDDLYQLRESRRSRTLVCHAPAFPLLGAGRPQGRDATADLRPLRLGRSELCGASELGGCLG